MSSGFVKARPVPEALRKFLGLKEDVQLPRTEIAKQIYSYVRDKNLRDKDDRRIIHPDKTLQKLFSLKDGESLDFKNFQKYLSIHYNINCLNTESDEETDIGYKKQKVPDEIREFLNIEEHIKLSIFEVRSKIFHYIRDNKLRDTDNIRDIYPDNKLRKLLHVDKGIYLEYNNIIRILDIHYVDDIEESNDEENNEENDEGCEEFEDNYEIILGRIILNKINKKFIKLEQTNQDILKKLEEQIQLNSRLCERIFEMKEEKFKDEKS